MIIKKIKIHFNILYSAPLVLVKIYSFCHIQNTCSFYQPALAVVCRWCWELAHRFVCAQRLYKQASISAFVST